MEHQLHPPNADKRAGIPISAGGLLGPDYTFDPEALVILGAAYDKTMASLGAPQPKAVGEIIAQRIIEAAGKGERDLERLCLAALRQTYSGLG
jgi:hypothetical protein